MPFPFPLGRVSVENRIFRNFIFFECSVVPIPSERAGQIGFGPRGLPENGRGQARAGLRAGQKVALGERLDRARAPPRGVLGEPSGPKSS